MFREEKILNKYFGKKLFSRSSAHLKKFSDFIIVEQKLLSVRLVAAVVHVLVKVPFQTQKCLSNHTRIVRIELDALDQNAGNRALVKWRHSGDDIYVLWKSAICWKFMKIKSLLSRTILGTFFSGLSMVLM